MKYPVCTLSNVINPGIYYVVSTDREHVCEVLELEENMRKEMFHDASSEFEFCCQMCVAVTNMQGKFKRGVIEKKIKDNLFQVLLIDYGSVVYVRKSSLKMITNKKFMEVEPLAFVVKLYGIIPTVCESAQGISKHRASKEWRPESKAFVESLFNDNPRIVVQSILIQQRIVYGDLFVRLKENTKFISLRKLLCKNGFCVYSESHFLKKEGLDTSGDSLQMETKMELVEKWQRENFAAQFQKRASSSLVASATLSSCESVCEASQQTRSMSAWRNEISETTPVVSETVNDLGVGRGKIKLLIAEMKKREETLRKDVDYSHRNVKETKVSMGRGQFLKKYLEIKKSSKSGNGTSGGARSTPAVDLREVSYERFSDAEKCCSLDTEQGVSGPKVASRMERAVVKATDFCEASDSNELIEVSLSTEEEIPAVRNVTVNSIKASTTEITNDAGDSRNELNESECDVRTNSAGSHMSDLRGKEQARRLLSSEPIVPDSWTAKNYGGHYFNQFTCNSSWTPYVRFYDSVVEPVKTFEDLPIQPSIIKNLKRGGSFSSLSQVQRWAIPAIRKLLNTVIIGSPQTGKTLSYVIHLMDYLQDECYFEELPKGNGPSVVIVASSSRICESIYYLCYSLLGCDNKHEMLRSKVKIVLAHGGGCEKNVWVTLTNGCDVLISTPHCLARLLEMPVLTNLERLTCLVLDEIDVISENPFRKNVRIILEKAQYSSKGRYSQKIFCGEKWTASVANLVKAHINSCALVIGSCSEAVVYEGLKPSVCLVEQSKKKEVLLEKLKDEVGKRRTVVVCEGASEAVSIKDFLSAKGISAFLAHEKILADKLKGIRAAWKSSKEAVLIATDEVLNELNIREAQALFHYGLPNKSKTNFYLRYFTLENFLWDLRSFSKPEEKTRSDNLHDIILIDDENHYQLPHIVEFVSRLGGNVSTKILRKCQEIRRQIEVEKFSSPICENLLAFGCCRHSRNCPRRHAFVQLRDARGSLPSCGWVNFVVLKTLDASCFSVRLVEHTDFLGKTSKFQDLHSELHVKLIEFYKCESNRRPHGVSKVGDSCAVRTDTADGEVFYRARIIEYLKVDKHEKPLEVRLKLIDEGSIWKRKTIELYELPEELSKYPPTAVDVRIVGVQPLDFDVSWSQVANDFTRDLMLQKLEENQYWSGKIVLALNGTLFLDPLKRKQFLPQLNAHVFDFVVREELLNNGMASPNDQHLPSLLRLCSEGGIELPETEGIKEEDSTFIQPQWAFLDLAFEFVPVRFLAAESTSTIFLQNKKFEKLLLELEEECQKEGARTRSEVTPGEAKNGAAGQTVSVGSFCLALFEDGKWNRGRIETETEREFYVYFIDHGDFLYVAKSDVVPIPQSLLLRLPCQAVECSLAGLEEKEECPLEVLEKIYSFSDGGRKDLYARVVRKDLTASVTGGRKYSLNLVDRTGFSLNKMLVDSEMVRPKESEREHLKNIEAKLRDDEEDSGQGVGEEEVFLDEGEGPPHLKLLQDYFSNLADDVFEDEGAQEFLKEFATKIFNYSGVPEGSVREKVKENLPALNASAEVDKTGPERGKQIQDMKNFHKIVDRKEKHRGRAKKELELRNRGQVLTPQVLWCQNQLEVQLKILLGGVQDYSFECTVNHVSFRCFLGEKFYSVDLRLYGAVNPQMTKVTLKAFHVAVILTKLAFPLWPRLHADGGKFRWINLDVESLCDKDDLLSDRIRSAKLEIESGALKKGIRSDNVVPCSDSECSDVGEIHSGSDSSSESHF